MPGFEVAERLRAYLPMSPQLLPVLLCAVMILLLMVQKVMRQPRSPSGTSQGSSQWSTKRQLAAVGAFNEDGMYLGYAYGQYVRAPREMSVVIFGPPGTGKSWTHFDTTLTACDAADVIYIDLTGDLVDHTAAWRGTLGRFFLLDFNDPLSPDQLNFHDLIRWGQPEMYADCQRAANHIVRPREAVGSRGAQHYDRVATALIPLTMLYLHQRHGGSWNYEDLLDFYSTPGQTPESIIRDMGRSASRTLQRGAARLLTNGDPRRLQSDWSAAAEWFTLWENPVLARTTSRTTIPLHHFQQGPKDVRQTLAIRMSAMDAYGPMQPVLRLLLDQVLFRITNRRSTEYVRQLYILIDDVGALGYLPILEYIAAQMRKYGIHIMVAYQSPTQLWDVAGRYSTGLLNSCGCWVIYPQYEPDSAEYLAKKSGETTIIEPSDRVNQRGWSLTHSYSKAEQSRGRKLLTADEIMSMRDGELMICVGTEKVKGQRIDSRRWKPFRRRLSV